MGLGTSEQKIYLQIGYGKLRKKTTVPGEGVVKRFTKDGEETLAYEYNFVEGLITNIYYKESKDYGNSFEVTIKDGKEVYNISFKENSRYCQDFLSKLPSIVLGEIVKITPYEMLGDNGKLFRGVSIQQNGVKLQNYFVKKEGEERKHLHGFPKPAVDNLSEKQWKIYCIEMQDFLAQYTLNEIIPKLKEGHSEPNQESENVNNSKPEEDDEIPF